MIGSNHTTNEENYLLNRFARVTLGTNNIDHHRTADYAGLAAALGARATDSHARRWRDVYNAPAVLLIGNDVTQQNPLVAWQIRTGVRHHGLKLYVINSLPSKIHRQAKVAVEVAEGRRSRGAVRWLATEKGNSTRRLPKRLVQLKAALEAENDVVVLFGAEFRRGDPRSRFAHRALRRQDEIHGAGRLREFARRRGHGHAARPPARLRALSDSAERARFGKLWGGEISDKPGLTARAMMEAAVAGKLKAALRRRRESGEDASASRSPTGSPGLELLVVHDMFLTETAQRADMVLPAASTYEKDGTLTNTAGEVQLTHARSTRRARAAISICCAFFRTSSSMLGLGTPIRLRTPEAAFDEIRQNVAGYDLSTPRSARRRLRASQPQPARRPKRRTTSPAGAVFSSHDYLFTSGTLGRYCSRLSSTNEAKQTPWSSSPSTQSWWYR